MRINNKAPCICECWGKALLGTGFTTTATINSDKNIPENSISMNWFEAKRSTHGANWSGAALCRRTSFFTTSKVFPRSLCSVITVVAIEVAPKVLEMTHGQHCLMDSSLVTSRRIAKVVRRRFNFLRHSWKSLWFWICWCLTIFLITQLITVWVLNFR